MTSRFAKAFVEGIYRFKTDKRVALATIEKYTKTKTTTESEQVYEIYANRYVKRAPEITFEGMQTVLEEIAESRPLPAGIGPQRFLNSRYFKELSRERLRGRALSKPLTFLTLNRNCAYTDGPAFFFQSPTDSNRTAILPRFLIDLTLSRVLTGHS